MDAEWRLPAESVVTVNLRWIAVVLPCMLASLPCAQASLPTAVQAYLDTLNAVEEADPPVSMEALFAASEAAQDELMHIGGAGGSETWIEGLGPEEYTALSQQLRGFRLSRGRDVYAQPDPNFLSELAQRQGRPEDRDFFRIYRRSWGVDLVPSYLRLTTRVSPCVRFSEGIIPDLYDAWRGFRSRYPEAYTAYATQSVRDLEEAVELGTCACGVHETVEQELSGFVTRFPDTPARPAILARLQELEDDPERHPVQCR